MHLSPQPASSPQRGPICSHTKSLSRKAADHNCRRVSAMCQPSCLRRHRNRAVAMVISPVWSARIRTGRPERGPTRKRTLRRCHGYRTRVCFHHFRRPIVGNPHQFRQPPHLLLTAPLINTSLPGQPRVVTIATKVSMATTLGDRHTFSSPVLTLGLLRRQKVATATTHQ